MSQNSIISQPQQYSPSGGDYILGAGLYTLWGLVPMYLKLFVMASAYEVVLHRIVWSLLFLLLFMQITRRFGEVKQALENPRIIKLLIPSAILISINFLLNVVATAENHILAISLGYFLTPLVNVGLGMLVLHEKISRAQSVSIAFAIAGATLMAITAFTTLWLSIVLALCFGFYGFLRKIAPVNATVGLMIETALLTPIAMIWMMWLYSQDAMAFGKDTTESLLLASCGIVLMLPLLVFGVVVRRLPLVAIGLLQFIAPSVSFLIALFIYHEPLGLQKLMSFVLIWLGLIFFSYDTVTRARAARLGI